jgi:hypothetical protein
VELVAREWKLVLQLRSIRNFPIYWSKVDKYLNTKYNMNIVHVNHIIGGVLMENSRINQQKKAISAMIKIYCNKKHNTKGDLCTDCREILNYALLRLDNCKFGNNKPNCSDCKIHCYKKEMREKITEIMKYSGPRVIVYNPKIALEHLISKIKNKFCL